MKKFERAVLFVNGQAEDLSRIDITEKDYLVAVDGGLYHLLQRNLLPHLLMGDLDSVNPQVIPLLHAAGTQILRFPARKDQTDLELALYHVIARGFRNIMVVAALGNRLDQTLGNLALVLSPDFEAIDILMDDGKNRIYIIRAAIAFPCSVGDTISLMPACKPARGITTGGLAYPLVSETLLPHQTRGISNESTSEEVSIQIESGVLLCIHTRQERNKSERK